MHQRPLETEQTNQMEERIGELKDRNLEMTQEKEEKEN